MKSKWNPNKGTYDIEMTVEELGTVSFALDLAHFRVPDDEDIINIRQSFLNLGMEIQQNREMRESMNESGEV